MFLVQCVYPLGEGWEDRDKDVYTAAGEKSHCNITSSTQREHCWYYKTFECAAAVKGRLEKVPGVKASMREL